MQVDIYGKTQKITEAMVLRDIQQYLKFKGIFGYRSNAGAFTDERTKRFIRYGVLGGADLTCIYPTTGQYWACEVKRPGGLLSDGQIAFLRGVRKSGGVILVAESIRDVEECLRNPGFIGDERYKKLLT